MLRKFLRNERGATAIEYGLIVGVLSLAIVGGISLMMNAIKNNFDSTKNIIQNSTDQ